MSQVSPFYGGKPAKARPSAVPGSDIRVPVNLDAERSVLGSILERPELVRDLVAANLQPADFGLDAHRSIYQRILDLDQSSRPIDEISLAEELLAHGELEKIGGRAYLLDLSYLVVPDRKRVLYHAAITTKNARLRSIQVMGEGAQAAAGTPGADPKQLGRELIAKIEKILAEAEM